MLKRAWQVFAVLWALLLLWVAHFSEQTPAPAFFAIAFAPLAAPLVLRWFFGWVIFAERPSLRRPNPRPFRFR